MQPNFLLENYSKYFNDFTWWLSGERSLPFGLLVSFPWGMNEKIDMHIFIWRAMPTIQCRFFHSYLKEEIDVHIFIWRAMPTIQCACRFFHSYLKETKKINNQFLSESWFWSFNEGMNGITNAHNVWRGRLPYKKYACLFFFIHSYLH